MHAGLCSVSPIVIYSPDSDVFEIGMLTYEDWSTSNLEEEKQVFVQIRRPGPDQNVPDIVNINQLVREIRSHPDLQSIPSNTRAKSVVTLYALTGCDFVSFFHGVSKVQFFKHFCDSAAFICGQEGHGLADWGTFLDGVSSTDTDAGGAQTFWRLYLGR